MARSAARKVTKSNGELQAEREAIDVELDKPRTPAEADQLFDAATKAIEVFDKKIGAARAKRAKIAAEVEARREAAEEEEIDLQVPDIIDDIDKLIEADQSRVNELIARRDRIDNEFRVRARRSAEAKARKQDEAHDAVVVEMMAAENARLVAVERFELAIRQAVQSLNASFDAAEQLRRTLNQFKIERPVMVLSDLSRDEFIARQTYRLSALLSSVKEQRKMRNAGLNWHGHPAYPASKTDWRDDEARRFAAALEAVQAYPVKEAD